ncbi:MAG: GIY-YIG nuclease family protein [bacterium]|nr:GIY-YIG nuclease family protein [bacterium]
MYYVYILKSIPSGKRYTGVTTNLVRRVQEHNQSKTRKDYIPVWYCAFRDKQKAYQFEKYLKSGSGHAFAAKHLL